jgi:DNA oxidative demethylase
MRIVPWMLELRKVAAEDLSAAIIQKYPVGAGIGWHRDDPQLYGTVVGMFFWGDCEMQFRPFGSLGRATSSVILPPESVYVLADAARDEFEHRIPDVKTLRYSITFRTLRARLKAAGGGIGGLAAASLSR